MGFVDLPQIIVEAALNSGTPVSGAGTMTLDSASFGLLGTDFLAGADTWTDITQWVRGFTITRPFSRVQGPIAQFQAGTISVTLNNSDARFDPDNLSGPYVGNSGIPATQHALFNSGAVAPVGTTITVANSDGPLDNPWDVISLGTTANIVGDSTHPLHGGNAYMLTIGGTSATALVEWTTSEGTQSTVYFRMYLYFTGNPSSAIRPIAFRAGANLAAAIGISTAGKLQLIDSTNTVDLAFTNSIPLNQWFRIEGSIKGDAAAGFINCSLYSNTESTTATETNTVGNVNTSGLLTQYWFGEQASVTNVGPYWFGGVGISEGGPIGPVATQLGAMVPVRLSAIYNGIEYPLFHGFADSWQEPSVTYAGQVSDWTLNASDGFKILSGQTIATGVSVGANEATGARINRILDAAGWYTGISGTSRQVDAGDSTVQATTFGDTALNLLQVTSDSEIGQLYINASGAVVFRHRRALLFDTRSNTSQATFGDSSDDTALPCTTIARMDDDLTIGNDIQATRVGGTLQEAKDTASITKYLFARTYTRSDLILVDDATALQWAQWVLYVSKTGEDRFDSITIDPVNRSTVLWPQILGRDIGDRITVIRRPPQGGNSYFNVSRDVFIAGISHTFDVASAVWNTSFQFQDASKYGSFLTLNNATLGQLNNNALAF